MEAPRVALFCSRKCACIRFLLLIPSITVAQVYQVVHEGVIKVAKKTNLTRLGVGGKHVDRVFGRFVKELYILSQMHSDRYAAAIGCTIRLDFST